MKICNKNYMKHANWIMIKLKTYLIIVIRNSVFSTFTYTFSLYVPICVSYTFRGILSLEGKEDVILNSYSI